MMSVPETGKKKKEDNFVVERLFDTFCPVGPCLATADEIPDPSNLTIRSYVNDKKMQESKTDDMIFDVPTPDFF